MAGLIPQTFIDDLLDRIDIVDVVNGRVQLKKAGKNYKACCPFHEEKSPSFTVAQDKQFYYCFGYLKLLQFQNPTCLDHLYKQGLLG